MALRDEIVPYIDGNGLVAPGLAGPSSGKASGNGPMYTSEYYIMLSKRGQLSEQDKVDFANKIGSCMNKNDLLNCAPYPTCLDQEGPDDYYGVLDGCKVLGNSDIPRKMLKAVFKYFGALNNNQPGKWTFKSFLIRQPQLLACMIASAFPKWNPLHFVCRMLSFPLFFCTSIIIAFSCLGTDPNNADARRLGWHLVQNTKGVSLLCWLASKLWFRRLYKTYGEDGMKVVAKIYYHDHHPFERYWVTE